MSHFLGTIRGAAGEGTRRGTKASGLVTHAASWSGAVRVELEHVDGVDVAVVSLVPWRNSGVHRELYRGPVDQPELTSVAVEALDVMGKHYRGRP